MNKKIISGIGIGIVILAIIGVALFYPSEEIDEIKPPDSAVATETKEKEEFIYVDIKGAVAKPDVYKLKKEQRLKEAIEMAGGFTQEADTRNVNLAKTLEDQMLIYVPPQGEAEPPPTEEPTGEASGTPATTAKVNINTADLTQLQTLSGIGAKKAQDIIDYRATNGSFKNTEELKNIKGIGEKMFEKIKENVCI
ncbi:MAG: helix-hairpin-helix domain-containing protein [Lactobacillales bacterium]|jgi:competence protein ComEA|nr:helix-hairpin-helix domain-containing protein [Lactobacillales bacterium]